MIYAIRALQPANPKFGFTCAVDVPKSGKVAGFLTHIKTENKQVWQTHHLEEFKTLNQAARHLLDEYRRVRSHPHAKPIKLDALLWFHRLVISEGFNVNTLSEQELILATTILDQRNYLSSPDIRHSYWLPLQSQCRYQIRFWDVANPWLKPIYFSFKSPTLVAAKAREKTFVDAIRLAYINAVHYCYYQI